MYTATILAGGQGRRLGGVSKALLSVGQRRIIDRQLTTLRAMTDNVAIVANDHACYGDLGVPMWPDVVPDSGPLGGILTALLNATTSQVLVVAGDMPFLNTRLLRHLIDVGRTVDVAIPRDDTGFHPLCASYGAQCVATIQQQIESGALKVTEILPALVVQEVGTDELHRLDATGAGLLNVNTADDYARANALVKHHELDR